jgi:hypothetical protein
MDPFVDVLLSGIVGGGSSDRARLCTMSGRVGVTPGPDHIEVPPLTILAKHRGTNLDLPRHLQKVTRTR